MKAIRTSWATALLIAASQMPALADCQCFAEGRRFHHGEIICLSMPAGRQLVQCGMVLNNSAWLKLQDGCPLAEAEPLPDLIHAPSGIVHEHGHGHMQSQPAEPVLTY
jgi:hypothetical protein